MVSQPPYRALLFYLNCDTVMHTEIRFHGDPPTCKERRIVPARSPKRAAEMERQLRLLRLEYLRRQQEFLSRVFNR